MQFELTGNSREGDIEAQPKMIEDVRVGTIDMAIVGVRAFDSLDVNSFDALMAPMLIDSYELEQAVFEAGIPEQMLTSLDETGVVGVAVLPAALSRILGTTHPFVTVDDFADQTVYAQNSDVGSANIRRAGRRHGTVASWRTDQRFRCDDHAARCDLGPPLGTRCRLRHDERDPVGRRPGRDH